MTLRTTSSLWSLESKKEYELSGENSVVMLAILAHKGQDWIRVRESGGCFVSFGFQSNCHVCPGNRECLWMWKELRQNLIVIPVSGSHAVLSTLNLDNWKLEWLFDSVL